MRIDIYSDITCPWCYIGHARLERTLGAMAGREGVELRHRPFQLDPDAPADPVPVLEHLRSRYGAAAPVMLEQATGAARADGIEINFDSALSANTFDAHRVLRLAREEYGHDLEHALLMKLFAAHFTHGGDVSNHEQLAGLAASVGMNVARARAMLATAEMKEEVEEEIGQAHRIGVRAVPTFVFEGGHVIQGAQPIPAFVTMLQEARQYAAAAEGQQDGSCAHGACSIIS